MSIRFGGVTLVTDDVPRLRAFYAAVFGGEAEGDEFISSLSAGGLRLGFEQSAMLQGIEAFNYIKSGGADNIFFNFGVDDADAEYERLTALGVETLNKPVTHEWGARSFQFRDPEGNIVNFVSR
ncbi:MAG: VOC family protein [Defluviitaleaceae bacterium]|nr:VOC family protein [Defluviitaleaceae bacterium]